MRCSGCSSLNPESEKAQSMNFGAVFSVLKNIDIREFVLCGNNGEPLEHEEIASILVALTKNFPDATIHVSTNGEQSRAKLSPETLKLLGKQVHFQIAVDGHKSGIHELTRRKGNLESVFENIQYLLDHNANISLIYSRHLLNEAEAIKTHELTMERWGVPLLFRDTTQVTETIQPPSKISNNGNVSILYSLATESRDFVPNMKHLYIEFNGESYPCVSFCKHKTEITPVKITDYQDSVLFLKDYIKFQSQFCTQYQKSGDLRQCNLNCGIYRNNFKYDTIEDLKAL